MNRKSLLFVALAFCLVTTLFIAVPAFAGTSPPFDLYAAVKDIQTKVNLIWSGIQEIGPSLSSMKAILIALEQKLWSAGDSVKNDTLAINAKLENVTKMESYGGSVFVDHQGAGYFYVNKSKPFKVTLVMRTVYMDPGESFEVFYVFGNYSNAVGATRSRETIVFTSDETRTLEFVCQEFTFFDSMVIDAFQYVYSYVIEYSD